MGVNLDKVKEKTVSAAGPLSRTRGAGLPTRAMR